MTIKAFLVLLMRFFVVWFICRGLLNFNPMQFTSKTHLKTDGNFHEKACRLESFGKHSTRVKLPACDDGKCVVERWKTVEVKFLSQKVSTSHETCCAQLATTYWNDIESAKVPLTWFPFSLFTTEVIEWERGWRWCVGVTVTYFVMKLCQRQSWFSAFEICGHADWIDLTTTVDVDTRWRQKCGQIDSLWSWGKMVFRAH